MSTLNSSNVQVGQSVTTSNNITLSTAANGDLLFNKGASGALTEISRITNNGLMASDKVGYLPAGTGAVASTVQGKLRESVSVKDFGAVGNGVADDTNSFSLAAQNATSNVNIVGAEAALPRALMCSVEVPAGSYLITQEVDTSNKEVTWIVAQGAFITGFNYLNGKVLREGQRQNDYQHGTTDYACGYSIRANGSLEDGAEVLGITDPSQLATYSDRDSVSLYVDNTAPAALIDVASATYTATTVTITAPSSTILKRYRKGMIIDTKHSTKFSGIVTSWNTDGSVLTVTGWYLFGGGGTPSTPSGTNGCYLNSFTKVWAHNANIMLTSTSSASQASGFELGVLNNKGALDFANGINQIWGFDAVNLGTYEGANAFIARGGSAKFFRGFQCNDATQASFYTGGTPQVGFWTEQTAGIPYKYTKLGVDFFRVNADGSIFTSAALLANSVSANTSLSLGTTSASTPFIDFNSSGNSIDYDARIIALGGSAVVGSGTLKIQSALTSTENKLLAGGSTSTGTSAGIAIIEGQSTTQPSIFAARCGTNDANPAIFHFVKDRVASPVQTGDNLGEIRFEGSATGGYFRAASIAGVASGTLSATSMPGLLNFRVTKTATTVPVTAFSIQPDHTVTPGEDNTQTLGSASLRWSTVYAGTGSINTSDSRQKQQVRELSEAELAVARTCKGLIRAFKFNDAVSIKGSSARIHFGVIAQDVKSAFEAEGLNAEEYAVLCYDEWDEIPEVLDENGEVSIPYTPAGNRYGIRYEELLAFIIAAL